MTAVESVTLPLQLIRLRDGSLRELGRVCCSVCFTPMPEPESGEFSWYVPGRGFFHDGCYKPPSRPEVTE